MSNCVGILPCYHFLSALRNAVRGEDEIGSEASSNDDGTSSVFRYNQVLIRKHGQEECGPLTFRCQQPGCRYACEMDGIEEDFLATDRAWKKIDQLINQAEESQSPSESRPPSAMQKRTPSVRDPLTCNTPSEMNRLLEAEGLKPSSPETTRERGYSKARLDSVVESDEEVNRDQIREEASSEEEMIPLTELALAVHNALITIFWCIEEDGIREEEIQKIFTSLSMKLSSEDKKMFCLAFEDYFLGHISKRNQFNPKWTWVVRTFGQFHQKVAPDLPQELENFYQKYLNMEQQLQPA